MNVERRVFAAWYIRLGCPTKWDVIGIVLNAGRTAELLQSKIGIVDLIWERQSLEDRQLGWVYEKRTKEQRKRMRQTNLRFNALKLARVQE